MENKCIRNNAEKMIMCINCNNVTHTYCNKCTRCGKSKKAPTSLTEQQDVVYISREECLGLLTLLALFSALIGLIAIVVSLFG